MQQNWGKRRRNGEIRVGGTLAEMKGLDPDRLVGFVLIQRDTGRDLFREAHYMFSPGGLARPASRLTAPTT